MLFHFKIAYFGTKKVYLVISEYEPHFSRISSCIVWLLLKVTQNTKMLSFNNSSKTSHFSFCALHTTVFRLFNPPLNLNPQFWAFLKVSCGLNNNLFAKLTRTWKCPSVEVVKTFFTRGLISWDYSILLL